MSPRLISLGLTTIGGTASAVELAHQVPGHRRQSKSLACQLNSDVCYEIIERNRMGAREDNRGIELITNPPPGSKLAAAKEFGIDLTLLLENLALTPTERLQKLLATGAFHEDLRQAGQRFRMR